ncbi:hypothetical protein [Burkholderia gladioli]|uniref:hypothetical protein n=1 Tax=Burkholderia gladioli TaxID=28095 RepID=UPI001C5CFB69|nr:hypothetical protein [Burkholderia gladioli]MBW5285937.1 hypothetical protein [Burkholderia gladioli]
MASILPNGKTQFIDQNGRPLVGGKVYFYEPNTETFKDTFTDSSLTTPNPNPVILDGKGQATIWGSGTYRQVVFDNSNVPVWDQIVSSSASTDDLASSAGAGMIGIPGGSTLAAALLSGINRTVDSIAALRTLDKTIYTRAFVTGYYSAHDGGGGAYQYDPLDTTSVDNGGTIIKAADGGIWKMGLSHTVALRQFGAKGNATDDDFQKIKNAITWIKSIGGGQVIVDSDGKFYSSTSIDILAGVTLAGVVDVVGTLGDNTSAPYNSMGGAILLGTGATLNVFSSSSLASVLIYPKGMTFPQTDASTWTGTAVMIKGDDASISRCMILGFNLAVGGGGIQRPYIGRCKIDCVNGIDLEMVLDVVTLDKLHGWPFATIATVSKPSNWSDRGTFINLHDTVDWANVLDCFEYNYSIAVVLNGVAQTTLSNLKTDGPFTVAAGTGRAGTIGVLVEGNSTSTRIIAPQINSCQFSVVVNIPKASGSSVTIDGGALLSSGNPITGPYNGAALLVQSGDVNINTRLHYHSNGIRVTNADSVITGNVHFEAVAQDIVCDVMTSNVFLRKATFSAGQSAGQQVVVGDLRAPTVSSASGGVNLPINTEVIFVNGATNFGAMSGGFFGRTITLIFATACTVFSQDVNAQTNMRLQGNANRTVAVGNALTLRHDGLQWREIGFTS